MKEDIKHLQKINYLLTRRNEFLQDLLWDLRNYLVRCKLGIVTLDLDYLIEKLD